MIRLSNEPSDVSCCLNKRLSQSDKTVTSRRMILSRAVAAAHNKENMISILLLLSDYAIQSAIES